MKILKAIINLITNEIFFILKIFYFSECIICKDQISRNSVFCIECFKSINFIYVYCKKCGNIISQYIKKYKIDLCFECISEIKRYKYIETIRSLFIYEDNARIANFIFNIKNIDDEYMFDSIIKKILIYHLDYILSFDMICYVPNFKTKIFKKKFNSSELFAYSLIKNINKINNKKFSYKFNLIKKIKNNESQIGKNFSQRAKNVKNVFDINKKICKNNLILNKKILIVDDIFTTGATMNECAKILKKNGANLICGLSIARTKI